MKKFSRVLAGLLVGVLISPAWAGETKLSESAQRILNKSRKALVTVKASIRVTIEGQGRELRKVEVQSESNGTVVAPNGLTVLALLALSPEVKVNAGNIKTTSKSEVTDVKLIRHDGQERSAKVVLRDEELGLAFLLPTAEKKKKVPHIEMVEGAEPALLEELIVPHRFNKALNRQVGVILSRVRGIMKEPRTYFIPTNVDAWGCPVFNRAGQLVGILARRSVEGTHAAVILPSADVKELIEEALKAADDKKDP